MFENPTVNPNALCNSCVSIACCSSEFIFMFPYAGSSNQNASEQFVSYIHPSFCKLRYSFRPTDKNVTELGLEIQTALSVTIQN